MLELRLMPATRLKNVLEALNDMFSQAHFDFSHMGFKLQAMDTSHVAFIALLLRSEAFDHYRCDRDLSMGLNLDNMANAFYCANNDDIITIKAEENGVDAITFTFESPSNGDITDFGFRSEAINDMPRETPEFPESGYQAIIRMSSAKLMRICKKLSRFGWNGDRDTIASITVDEEGADFFTRGKAGTSTAFCRSLKPEEPTHIEMKEKVFLNFDLRRLTSISNMSTLSDQMTISLSSTLPAVFECKIAEVGYIRYYMMPMVEADETQRISKDHKMQNEGDEVQRISKEDKMQNEGDEMQRISKKYKMQNVGDEMQN